MELLRSPNKRLRAIAIKEYMQDYQLKGVVCFSCGNASRALREAGVDTLDISPTGDLQALRWFTPGEIAREFPGRLDATSGHLGPELMNRIARTFREYFGEGEELAGNVYLPTGSGETLVALKMAYPWAAIHAVYDLDAATEYSEEAPLNALVEVLAESIISAGGAL